MTDSREKTLDRIRALLSKTTENGCTQEEALAALDKARAFMDAYEVTEADLQLAKDEGAILRKEPPGASDPHGIKRSMSWAVAKFTDCRAWRNRRTDGGGLVFCGLQADVRFATWLLDHLTNFVQAELANHLMGNVAGRPTPAPSYQRICDRRHTADFRSLVGIVQARGVGDRKQPCASRGQKCGNQSKAGRARNLLVLAKLTPPAT
jgi:hypothetical protein